MTFEEILQGMLERVPSNVDKREGSIIYDALAPCAFFLAQQNFQLDNFVNLVFPDTAVGAYLDKAVAAYGVTRNPATCAVRNMTASGTVAIGSRWGINGLTYVVTEKCSETEYAAECETPGEIGNQYSGALQPLSSVAGTTGELAGIIIAGVNGETDEALRERFYVKVRIPATSGNAYHYKQWALKVSGVGDAKVYPLDQGPGTVTVLVVDDEKMIDVSLEPIVAAYIEKERPIGAVVTVGSPGGEAINVTADILPDGTKEREEVTESFRAALSSYLKSLVFTDYRVSFAKVGSLLFGVEGVKDYDNLKLNGVSANIIISDKDIPVIGTVDLLEVSVLETD